MFNKPTGFGSGWFESSSSNGGLFGSSFKPESGLFGNNIACGSPKPGTTVKFKAPQGQDSVIKNGSYQTITTDHQCIVAMKEYESKSLEGIELRLEDYTEGRRNAKSPGTIGQKGLFGQQQQLSTAGYGLFGQDKRLFGADDTKSSHSVFDLNANTTILSGNLSGNPQPGKILQNKELRLEDYTEGTEESGNVNQPGTIGQKGLFGQKQQLSTAGYGLFGQNKSLIGADDTKSSHSMFDFNAYSTKLSENLSGNPQPGKNQQNKNVTQSVSSIREKKELETLKATNKALTARVVALEKMMEVHSNQLGQILQARVEPVRTSSVLVSSDFVNDSDDDDCTQDYTEDKKEDEDEISVFSNRAKLFRFDRGSDRWKEKGVGDMKILQHKETDKYRLLLCREKVHKLACNHLLSPSIKMTAMPISETSWCWTAVDYADGESKIEQLAVEFKSIEVAQRFKEKVDEILENFKD